MLEHAERRTYAFYTLIVAETQDDGNEQGHIRNFCSLWQICLLFVTYIELKIGIIINYSNTKRHSYSTVQYLVFIETKKEQRNLPQEESVLFFAPLKPSHTLYLYDFQMVAWWICKTPLIVAFWYLINRIRVLNETLSFAKVYFWKEQHKKLLETRLVCTYFDIFVKSGKNSTFQSGIPYFYTETFWLFCRGGSE